MSKKKQIILSDLSTSDYEAVGIICSENEFQLSLIINSALTLKLSVCPPLTKKIKGNEYSFPAFYFDTENNLELKLIKNKSSHQVLFSSLKIYDYIIVFKGDDTISYSKIFTEKLKSRNDISLINPIHIEKLGKPKQVSHIFN